MSDVRYVWSDGLFKAARVCDVGRRDLADPRVPSRRIWGSTRGGNLATRADEDDGSVTWSKVLVRSGGQGVV